MSLILDISYKVDALENSDSNFFKSLLNKLFSKKNEKKIYKIKEITLIFKGLLTQINEYSENEASLEYERSSLYLKKLIKQEENLKSINTDLNLALNDCIDTLCVYNSRLKKVFFSKNDKISREDLDLKELLSNSNQQNLHIKLS